MKTPRIRHARHRDFLGAERGSAGIRRLQSHHLFLANRVADAVDGGIGDTAAPTTFTADAANDEIDAAAHGFLTGDGPFVVASDTTLPAGLVAGTLYWINALTAGTMSLHRSRREAALGLNAVAIDDAGTGAHTIALATTREAFNGLLRQGVSAAELRALSDVDAVLGHF